MNWWQELLVVFGVLVVAWLFVAFTFGLMLCAIAGSVAGSIAPPDTREIDSE